MPAHPTTGRLRGLRHARLATLSTDADWGLIDDGALLWRGAHLVWVGADADLAAALAALAAHGGSPADGVSDGATDALIDVGGALVTPGLIDAHTHLVYGGDRSAEFALRLEGASYEAIARAGGGIRSTVAATRAASEDELFALTARRARALMEDGVTTLEIKSGYGLSAEHEARCLRVARRIGAELPVSVRATALGAHALPPEFEGRADDYISAVCAWLPALQAEGLVDAVDAFCEGIGFTPAQVQRVFEAATALGLPLKLHAEQLSNLEGAALAARFGALSADHLEWLSDTGIAAMKASGTVAMLLPGAFYALRETRLPPIAALRAAGVPMAIATDHNPGTSPCLSLRLMLSMACTLFRLTPLEALLGATAHAARALGLADRGRLVPGLRADLAVWDAGHPRELAYYFGGNPLRRRVFGGATE